MSLYIQKKDFFELLQKAFPIIPLKSSLQILSNFKLSSYEKTFEVSATDLDHFIRVFQHVDCDEKIEITVNARKIFEIVREIPDGIVTLDINEGILLIKSEKGFQCKIAGSDIHDFPGFPEDEEFPIFSVSSHILKEIINKSSFAASKDESRSVLCGVFLEIKENTIGMVSTDGHRLGCSFYNNCISSDSSISCVVSPKSLLNLSRIFNKNDETVNIVVGDKYIVFKTNSLTMYSKLFEGPYPDYLKVIPKNNPKIAVIEKSLLQNAVKRVSVLSNQKTHLIKFNFLKNILEIAVSNREIGGEAKEEIPVFYDSDQHTIGFNSFYLLEILDIIQSEKIKFEMNTQISACLIFPYIEKEEESSISDDLFLIMPLRILDDF